MFLNMPTCIDHSGVFREITLAPQQPSSQQPPQAAKSASIAKFRSPLWPMALQSESKDTLLSQQDVRQTKTSGQRVRMMTFNGLPLLSPISRNTMSACPTTQRTSPCQCCTVLKFPWRLHLACWWRAQCCMPARQATLGHYQKPTRQMSTFIRTLHNSPIKPVVLSIWTPGAEHVESHMARNPDMQTPHCVASPPHNVNFD